MPNAVDLTTLANYKQWGGITGTADDALLGRLITAASKFILNWLNDNILQATYVERHSAFGGALLALPHGPVVSITSLVVNGQTIPASPDGVAGGYVGANSGIRLVGGYRFTRGYGNVAVTYVAGYATIPEDVEQACIELVELRYKQRGRSDITSKTLQGEVVSYKLDAVSDSILQTLSNYRRFAPL